MESDKVLKALAACAFDQSLCDQCPYRGKIQCEDQVMRDAITVISELAKDNASLDKARTDLMNKRKGAQVNIARMFAKMLKQRITDMECHINTNRKTVEVDSVLDWSNWLLQTVVPQCIDQVKQQILDEILERR